MGMKHVFILFLLVGTCFIPSAAQTVSGRAEEETSGAPLPGVIVKVTDMEGNLLQYALTDKDGHFFTSVTEKAGAISFALLGYESEMITAPFNREYTIRLSRLAEQIRESVIINHKVEEAGDTIRYQVASLKRQEDRVLSDFLSRIPGVEVSNTGYVQYNGKDINRFYVDGKDILGSSYNLATKNLSVDVVKTVEVLDRHQPLRLLQGIKESDRAAMNIVLTDEAKSKVNWGIVVGVGIEPQTPVASGVGKINSFYMGRKASSMNVFRFDNQGNALQAQEVDGHLNDNEEYKTVRMMLSIPETPLPFDESRSLFNRTLESSTADQVSFSASSSMRMAVKYGWDVRASSLWKNSSFQKPNDNVLTLNRKESGSKSMHLLSGKIDYRLNTAKTYVFDELYFGFQKTNGGMDISGDVNRDQYTGQMLWEITNSISAGFRIWDKVFSVSSFTQYSSGQENLKLENASISQIIRSGMLYERICFNGISKNTGRWSFGLTPQADIQLLKQKTSLIGIPETVFPGIRDGQATYIISKVGLGASIEYKGNPVTMGINGEGSYAWYKLYNHSRSAFLGNVSFFFGLVSGRLDFLVKTGIERLGPEIHQLGTPVILTDYYSLWHGSSDLAFPYHWRIGLDFRYRAPVSGWNIRMATTYSRGRSYGRAREVYDEYVLNYLTAFTNPTQSMLSFGEISKGVFSANGKITFDLHHLWTNAVFHENGYVYEYDSQYFSPEVSLSLSPWRFWGMVLNARFNLNGIKISPEYQWNMDFVIKYSNSFHFSKLWTGMLSVDIFYNGYIKRATVFPDMALICKAFPGMTFRLEMNNLLNNKTYTFRTVSPLSEERYSYAIRPLAVLLAVEYRF